MAFKSNIEIDTEQFATFLQNAVRAVKTEEDPLLLNELKKIYKQNVPFGMRTYVAAYLAKQSVNGGGRFRGGYKSRAERNGRPERGAERFSARAGDSQKAEEHSARNERPRVHIDDALAKTIFVGLGRNRHFFAKDLVGLLCSVAEIDRDRIGDIRVLSNYSFVQLFAEDAEKAIAKLNGYDYRRHPLSVSYAQQRSDRAAENPITDEATVAVEADAAAQEA